jgi:hypothetical protein
MTKGLSSYPSERRLSIAMRRTQKPKEKGNGYWAAIDYLARHTDASNVIKDRTVSQAVVMHVMVDGINKAKGNA